MFRATILLADSAQAAEGKLYILGGGWNVIGPDPTATAIAALIEVPWDLANRKHQWTLELLDGDGQPIELDAPDGTRQAVTLQGELEVGRPTGVKPGTRLPIPLAINLAPLPLERGSQFQWKFSIAGQTEEHWQIAFVTRP